MGSVGHSKGSELEILFYNNHIVRQLSSPGASEIELSEPKTTTSIESVDTRVLSHEESCHGPIIVHVHVQSIASAQQAYRSCIRTQEYVSVSRTTNQTTDYMCLVKQQIGRDGL